MSAFRGYDSWLTRQPEPTELEIVRCDKCGRFLPPGRVIHTINAEDGWWCDGAATDADLYDPLCGGPAAAHKPHFVVETIVTCVYRRCSAGHIAKELFV